MKCYQVRLCEELSELVPENIYSTFTVTPERLSSCRGRDPFTMYGEKQIKSEKIMEYRIMKTDDTSGPDT